MYWFSRSHGAVISIATLLALTACGTEQQNAPADSDAAALQQDTTNTVSDSTRLAYNTFSDWDEDGNEDITREEFEERFNNYKDFDSLDTDGDGELSHSEFEERFAALGDFDSLDTDKNNVLSESELNAGVFGRWDANNDQLLDQDEWRRGMSSWRTE